MHAIHHAWSTVKTNTKNATKNALKNASTNTNFSLHTSGTNMKFKDHPMLKKLAENESLDVEFYEPIPDYMQKTLHLIKNLFKRKRIEVRAVRTSLGDEVISITHKRKDLMIEVRFSNGKPYEISISPIPKPLYGIAITTAQVAFIKNEKELEEILTHIAKQI